MADRIPLHPCPGAAGLLIPSRGGTLYGQGRDLSGPVGCTPNNSFKPNLLRYTKNMAEKACHVFGSTTQVGLTPALCCGPCYWHHSFSAGQRSQPPCLFPR